MARNRKNNSRRSRSQLFPLTPDSYADRTSRPVYALVYLLPFLVFYEFGTILINPEALHRSLHSLQGRVVAFLWVQNLLELIGFSGRMMWIATPAVVILILIAWQIVSRTKWTVNLKDLLPMTIECIVLAVPLLVLSLMVNRPAPVPAEPAAAQIGSTVVQCQAQAPSEPAPRRADSLDALPRNALMVDIVTGIGAGIYEELVFRLILIVLLMLFFQDVLKLTPATSVLLSVVISALAFSIHHHILFVGGRIEQGEPFLLAPFIFRTLAGGYFALLFAVRGFGITAGTHAFYDIIAALVRAWFLFSATAGQASTT